MITPAMNPHPHPQAPVATERRTRDRSQGIILRRRQKQPVDVDRRGPVVEGTPEIAEALEMCLDDHPTRRALLTLLETWLGETRNAAPEAQDAAYARALERSLEVVRGAPDVETGIAMLQRRG